MAQKSRSFAVRFLIFVLHVVVGVVMRLGPVESWPHILLPIGNVLVLLHVASEQDDVDLRVLHAPHQDGNQFVKMGLKHLFTDRLLSQAQPELTRLKATPCKQNSV